MSRLDRSTALLLIIDVQEKLMPVIANHEQVEANIVRLIRGAQILGVPILITEQYVKGLGHTVAPLCDALGDDYKPIEKSCFSGYRELDRKQVIVAGVETHVCVYQTVSDLLANGYDVTLVADALDLLSQFGRVKLGQEMRGAAAALQGGSVGQASPQRFPAVPARTVHAEKNGSASHFLFRFRQGSGPRMRPSTTAGSPGGERG